MMIVFTTIWKFFIMAMRLITGEVKHAILRETQLD